MVKYISYIFWGLLVVILDFKINQLDILPDFVGYILVSIGAGGLAVKSERFSTAQKSCWALIILALLELFVRGDWATILGMIHLAVHCIMIWFLLGGFMVLARLYERPDLAEKASHRRTIYIALMCVATVISLLAPGNLDADGIAIVVIAVVLTGLVLVVMILHLIHQVRFVIRHNSNATMGPTT